ncbi:MAG TPA: Nif3-like dinuclear metal center hexameric protein [Feifaniaceae bacterium]|nr:Nif3-like dinuclear metal center hexameric protein [Feifaniaceae bacterium]
MELEALLPVLGRIAPPRLAEEWDNVGLLIEPEAADITRILVALDCTAEVVKEAREVNAQLVLTHHPLFFKPVRRILHSDPDTAAAYALIRSGIGLYAMHTNLDCAMGGVNDALASALGLADVRPLLLPDLLLSEETQGLGRVGNLKEQPSLGDFARQVGTDLDAAVRVAGERERVIRRVAVVGGSGGDYIRAAKAAGADVLVTGEVRHHQALEALFMGLGLVEAGHYETECVVLGPLIAGLQAALEEIQYKVDLLYAKSGRAPLVSAAATGL